MGKRDLEEDRIDRTSVLSEWILKVREKDQERYPNV